MIYATNEGDGPVHCGHMIFSFTTSKQIKYQNIEDLSLSDQPGTGPENSILGRSIRIRCFVVHGNGIQISFLYYFNQQSFSLIDQPSCGNKSEERNLNAFSDKCKITDVFKYTSPILYTLAYIVCIWNKGQRSEIRVHQCDTYTSVRRSTRSHWK